MNETDAYILIGGRSRRLGSDKAAAELHGETLAQRAFRTVSEALPARRVTFVAASEAQFAIQVILAEGRFIFDLIADRGPIGGLHSALADARSEWIFVLACDYPFVSAELIRYLHSRVSNEFGAVVPEQVDGRLQPLCAFYSVDQARPVVQEIIERPRVPPPMHEIAGRMDPWVVHFDEIAHLAGSENFFLNVNMPTDLDLAREIERKLSPKIEIK
jgi:molybdopterin-guanine dinucleotide biosynthesis protein A